MAPESRSKRARGASADGTPPLWKQVRESLRNMTFECTPFNATRQAFERIGDYIKPGIGVVGSREEEAAYYEQYVAAERVEPQAIAAQIDDGDMPDASEESDEMHSRDSEDTGSDNASLIEDPSTGRLVHMDRLFGDAHEQQITDLYALGPIEMPSYMTVTPHDYQLVAANQADFLCKSPYKGMFLGDGMGVGKTLSAILAMWLVKDEPGFSMVVAPKTLCHQWVAQIEGSFEPGHGLTAYLLENASSMTAHELLALGMDVVVVGYEQVAAAARERDALPDRLDKFLNDTTGKVPMPRRPNAVLHSSFWKELGLPIKRLVLDEAQLVNKRASIRHQALKKLYYDSVIVLSGTLAHNKWHNLSGYIDFLSGHPFTTHKEFMFTFSSFDRSFQVDHPDLSRVLLLQKFLQAFTIIRPSSIIQLERCIRQTATFELDAVSRYQIADLMEKYRGAIGKSRNAAVQQIYTDRTGTADSLGLLVHAQLWSVHPMLGRRDQGHDSQQQSAEDPDSDPALTTMEDPLTQFAEREEQSTVSEARHEWLERVREVPDLEDGAPRLQKFLQLYEIVRRCNPTEKIVVFSAYLKFLDIIAEVLRRRYHVDALRYDGTVPQARRVGVQQAFIEADPSVPLLLTSTTGSYGLNITAANVVIQTEPWWNKNIEDQAIARVWRQGQEAEVMALMILGAPSEIDDFMMKVKERKEGVNNDVMKPLIRLPGQGPENINLRRVYSMNVSEVLPESVIPPMQQVPATDGADEGNMEGDDDVSVKAEDA